MTTHQLDALFTDYFARNRGPGYAIEVTSASPDLSEINIRVTFLNGRSYCCAEPGCHFSLDGLRKVASERRINLPDDLRICFHGIVEKGADLHSSGGITRRYEYDEAFFDGA